MSHHVIEYDAVCGSCSGTGLYVGMAERDGYAVVCSTCKGTGCKHIKHEYDDFEERIPQDKVTKVIQHNPGIMLGGNFDFGGMSYDDWSSGKEFESGMEMRMQSCPRWWYQGADYKKASEWVACNSFNGRFSDCRCYSNKEACWARWDSENK